MKFLPGDKVLFRIGEGVDDDTRGGAIEELLPRKNELIRPAVSNIDMALVMTVSPGFAGQKLIKSTLKKIESTLFLYLKNMN